MGKKALICGVSGQDGAYLTRFLSSMGYAVIGTSRSPDESTDSNLRRLGVEDAVQLVPMRTGDLQSVLDVLGRHEPDEIYNLSGQSSVGLSFDRPVESFESIANGTVNLLEGVRRLELSCRVFSAGSGECFGDLGGLPADEATPFRPKSPYAVAKCAAHWQTVTYREAYGLFASNGILFNHESPLRPLRFVTRKIVNGALRISHERSGRLALGNVDVRRDWGWAPEYVEGFWRALQADAPSDFVFSTGLSMSLGEFCALAFQEVGLDWEEWVDVDPGLARPAEIRESFGNAEKARRELQWSGATRGREVVRKLIEAERDVIDAEYGV